MTIREKLAVWFLNNHFVRVKSYENLDTSRICSSFNCTFLLVALIFTCLQVSGFYTFTLVYGGQESTGGGIVLLLLCAFIFSLFVNWIFDKIINAVCKKELKEACEQNPDKVLRITSS